MREVNEYVGIGHPDRLADNIVARIVNEVLAKDKDAFIGLECAVNMNKVFIDGRIAAGKNKLVITNKDIEEIIQEVYDDAKYNEYYNWHPYDSELKIIESLCIENLRDEERKNRVYSDDQNVVIGYALNNKYTNFLPLGHFIALKIGNKLSEYIDYKKYGSDYKILVDINNDDFNSSWNRLTLSIRHHENIHYKEIFKYFKKVIDQILYDEFDNYFPKLSYLENDKFLLNGSGDFINGGPNADNGLSGKKLAIDFYGTNIPLGGGAIYGKDPHKIDVCGSLRARELAVNLVQKYNFYSVLVKLSYCPGEETPYCIEAYEIDKFNTKIKIDDSLIPNKDYFSIKSINEDLELHKYNYSYKLKTNIMSDIK